MLTNVYLTGNSDNIIERLRSCLCYTFGKKIDSSQPIRFPEKNASLTLQWVMQTVSNEEIISTGGASPVILMAIDNFEETLFQRTSQWMEAIKKAIRSEKPIFILMGEPVHSADLANLSQALKCLTYLEVEINPLLCDADKIKKTLGQLIDLSRLPLRYIDLLIAIQTAKYDPHVIDSWKRTAGLIKLEEYLLWHGNAERRQRAVQDAVSRAHYFVSDSAMKVMMSNLPDQLERLDRQFAQNSKAIMDPALFKESSSTFFGRRPPCLMEIETLLDEEKHDLAYGLASGERSTDVLDDLSDRKSGRPLFEL